ncbi:MAG: hypothetical protein K6F90_02265 [Lachnospiraceae bacterium]|nr:hypothetical protein [Lachnospiraceae bacterium]
MSDRKTRMEWLNTLKSLQTKFNTGKRNLFGGSFKADHNELSDAVSESIMILEGYLDDEHLSIERAKQIQESLKKVASLAQNYMDVKKRDDNYALKKEGDIKEATGNNRERLLAADDLLHNANSMVAEIDEYVAMNQDRDEIVEGREPMTLEELKELDKESESVNIAASALHVAKKEYESSASAYDDGDDRRRWNLPRRKDFKKGVNLHLNKIMGFNTEQGFVESYKKHRFLIHKTVESYREIEAELESDNVLDRDQAAYKIRSLGMTKDQFLKMEDKINELDMAGRYMDVRAELLESTVYRNLTPEQKDNLYSKSYLELMEAAGVEIDDGKKQLLENIASLKNMEKYGIKQADKSTEHRINAFEGNGKYGNVSTKTSLGTAYIDTGKPSSAKNLKDYLKSKPVKVDASDGTIINYARTKSEKQQAGASINLVKAKARAGKIGASIKSSSGNAVFKGQITGVTVKTGASVSCSLSKVSFVDAKIALNTSAELKGIRAVAKGSVQTDNGRYKIDAKAEGELGEGMAYANFGLGNVSYKNENKETVNGIGVNLEVGAGIAAATGSVSGGFSIFGVRFGARLTGSVLSVGAYNMLGADTKRLNIGFNLGLGVFGIGLSFSVDWSGAVAKYRAWKQRKVTRKELKALRAREKGIDDIDDIENNNHGRKKKLEFKDGNDGFTVIDRKRSKSVGYLGN